jgi:hypothetical protein
VSGPIRTGGDGSAAPPGAPGAEASRPAAPSAYDTERLLRGELPPERAASIEAALLRAGRAEELEELRASDLEILARYPAPEVAREVERRRTAATGGGSCPSDASGRPATARPRWPWLLPLVGATAMASALLVVVQAGRGGPGSEPSRGQIPGNNGPGERGTNDPTEVIGLRGGEARLHIYRRAGHAAEADTGSGAGSSALADGARVKPGEMLQVRYVAASAAFGLIVSIDARGQVSRHWPEGGELAAPLQPAGERALPHAFELDDSPGFERFVFVTAPTVFATRPLIEALATGRPLPLGPGARATEITLIKDVP